MGKIRVQLFVFGCTVQHVGIPDQGLNPRPLQWKHGVLTTGPPGRSPEFSFEHAVFEMPKRHSGGDVKYKVARETKREVWVKEETRERECRLCR